MPAAREWGEPALQPRTEGPDRLADVAAGRLLGHAVVDEGQVVDQAPALGPIAVVEPLAPALGDGPGVGEPRLEPGDQSRILVAQRPHDVELGLAPGDDPAVAVLGPPDDLLDGVVKRGGRTR